MKTTHKSNLVSALLILGALGAVFGVGTFLLLVLMGLDIFLVILATVGVVALMVGVHYLLWGRTASDVHPHASPKEPGYEVTLTRDIEEDRAVVQERPDAGSQPRL
jgi:membrane protein implicated in regulation of membrane protease activity